MTSVEKAASTIKDLPLIATRKYFLNVLRSVSAYDLTAAETLDSNESFFRLSQSQMFTARDDSLVGRAANF